MEKKSMWICTIFMAALLTYTCVIAGTNTTQKEMSDAEAMNIFKKTFPNFKISDIRKAPIAGLYEIEGGGNIVYFDPNAVLLIFGEVLNKNGVNLTLERRNELAAKKLEQIPLDKAVKIGNGQKTVVLFTDPDCPYCRKVSEYFKTSKDITQYVFFYPLTQLHPNSATKAKYILGQKNPEKAYYEVMSGVLDKADPNKMKSDERAASRLAEHITLASKVGVNGTPVMWIDGKYITGANIPLIESVLK
ncbi:MAG: DsbC family protein [Syntrophaceae bacterium]